MSRVIYGQSGFGANTETIYGVPVSEHVAEPASNFLHAQSGICSVMTGQYLCSVIFGLIMVAQWQSLGMQELLAQEDDITNHNRAWTNEYLQYSLSYWWIQAICYFIFWTCTGMAIVAISMSLVQSRNSSGLQLCCIFEGICAGCGLCQCIQYCCYLVAVAVFVGNTGNAVTTCNTIINKNNALGFPTTTGGPTDLQSLPYGEKPQFQKCIDLVDGFHKIGSILCINLVIMVCCSGCAVGACSFGAKSARDTEEAIDEEEDGHVGVGINKAYY